MRYAGDTLHCICIDFGTCVHTPGVCYLKLHLTAVLMLQISAIAT